MMQVDHPAFVLVAVLLVVALRLSSRRTGRWIYAVVSVVMLAVALGDGASIAATGAFAILPFAVVRLRRSLPAAPFLALVAVQLFAVAVLRRYLEAVHWLGPIAHPALKVIGLSYIVLRQIEWMLWIDADDEAAVDLVEYTHFTLGMFSLLAGPIARYGRYSEAFLDRSEPERPSDVVGALNRVVNGYLLVVLVAPFLASFSSVSVVESGAARPRDWLLFVIAQPLQLYFNFSGYSDIVIGFARLCRFELPENFARPLFATNPQEFWQRWHMSFSTWMRDFVFYPSLRSLQRGALRAHSKAATALALLLTFALIGLWHGVQLGFLLFGVAQGLAVLLVGPYSSALKRLLGAEGVERYERSRVLRVVRVASCFAYFALTSVLFDRSGAELVSLWQHFTRTMTG